VVVTNDEVPTGVTVSVPPVGGALSSRNVSVSSPELLRRSTDVTPFWPGGVVAALVKL
jgi:hypothetical protein